MLIGAIEAGGTKVICGIGNDDGVIKDSVSFVTENPKQTMAKVISYFHTKEVVAIGVGTFGPINLDSISPKYGYITTTPKPGWAGYNFLGELQQHFDVPYGWDTDVNGAALGEAVWGAARGLNSCVYITLGTGVGIGIYTEGKLVHGLVHPEGGHVLTRRHADDQFEGCCPYHGDCLEGLASGTAIERRWNARGIDLSADHPAWSMEAFYIAQAITTTILMLSPKKVILGGGVMQQKHLYPLIRSEVQKQLNGYVNVDVIIKGIDNYIVPPGLGSNAGLYGALALGVAALNG